MVRNRDSNFELEIAVFSYPEAGVAEGLLLLHISINNSLSREIDSIIFVNDLIEI